MSVELSMLVAHVPRICHEDQVADFQKPMVSAMHKVSEELFETKPDVVIMISCHFTATFHHYVNCSSVHKGELTAVECPDLIADVPYNFQGDPSLAEQLVQAGKGAGLPILAFNDTSYVWDYGTLVPMRYLVPKENVPVIDLSVCWAASLDETFEWGRNVGKTLKESSKRAVFVSSGALSHNLVRGPEKMPTSSEQALDKQFTDYLLSGRLDAAREMLPQYAKIAGVESGGRHLAMLLGVMEGSGNYKAKFHGYVQSSGSGNAIITFEPLAG
ncbi:extradiol ring-cleavage dioxygenase [Paenibacillus alginolyticus]|uniref:Extradiol ring-cleavage dioxygenase n=1 Tax=Paenibacillus alginolyticus TaxID=59839 RepID=A0ABT4G921_9BACL|nr:extradiol ring-cleavage dioxygenase [Paenibacillus alginolyticus]MCY9666809.1 extradiol ring-cleavage dioxygenase [Paenibacillus alginolyticus]MCY9692663.1 extradiol ring-cleavage dioxygenase [Paenibacillus alginolyticus]MEC0148748.1 extradiol ring-cleavage dioxygenase [Paenibacillus alginolyticus]